MTTMTWQDFVLNSPWIATIQTCNNDWTIYACLQQACKQFENVLVIDDGSTDNTFLEIDRYIRREKPNNLHIIDVSSIDPWPELTAPKREGQEITSKTQSKAKYKTYMAAKQLAPQLIWVSIESDVILANDARHRMADRICAWDNPEYDCEFFNVIMSIDPWHVRSVTQSEEEYIKPIGIKHRKEYDHPGDWTLAASWLGGKLYPGPDPQFSYGPCFLPWIEKNQLLKKGQDDSKPFGFHMLSYREAEKYNDYSKKRFLKVDELNDNEVDWELLKSVRFPVISKLDELGIRRIQLCEW